MDYESRILVLGQVPLYLTLVVLLAERFVPGTEHRVVKGLLRGLVLFIWAMLSISWFLGEVGWLAANFDVPEQVGREVGATCLLALSVLALLSRSLKEPEGVQDANKAPASQALGATPVSFAPSSRASSGALQLQR